MAAMAVLAAAATASPASAAVVTTDLGTLPGHTDSQATSVRDDGTAVGYSHEPNAGWHAVLWGPSGEMTPLATPGRNSQAYDINDNGVVVGEAEPAGTEFPVAVWWDTTGEITRLPAPGGGSARGVNEAGVIVGSAQSAYPERATRWENASTEPTLLATLPGVGGSGSSRASDVNDEGTVVGYSTGSEGNRHAVTWDAAGAIRKLDTPSGYVNCYAGKINNSGLIVGYCSAGGDSVAVRWDVTGAAVPLPSLGRQEAEATGVSDAGIIVGYALGLDDRGYAVRWGAYGSITKLATLGGPHGVPYDINNTGTIVGRTQVPSGDFHATRWRNAG